MIQLERLLWFNGISWDTQIRDIGWTYVLLAILLYAVSHLAIKTVKAFNKEQF